MRVTALVPAAENAFGASSYRPGDVVRHYGGRTSEIANTDAEGRIVLADALAYAAARLKPTVLVDVATLTGAMKVALGVRTAGLFATSDALADAADGRRARRAASTSGGCRSVAEYERQLDSEVADANNAPGNPGGDHRGAVPEALHRAACRGRTSTSPGRHAPTRTTASARRGATGFGARLLADWVAGAGMSEPA